MPQVIEQGDIFGRIGKNIGEGLSEQLPKAAERSMLSSGLAKLGQSQETDPLKRLAQLYGTPGITPEIANQVAPYLQNRAIAEEGKKAVESSTAGQQPNVPSTENKQVPRRLQTTPEAIREGGQEYLRKFPLKFNYDVDKAQAQYLTDVKNQEAQIGEVRKELTDAASQKLEKHGEGTYSDVLGELQNEFARRAEDSVLSGQMSPSEAGRHFSKQMLDFAKARNKQKIQGPDRWRQLFSGNPLKELKSARKSYEEADMPEAFKNDLIAYQKLSEPRAAELAFPLSSDNQSFFDNIKKSKGVFSDERKVFSEALKRLSDKDSLQNFALQLDKKGYNPQSFLDYAADSDKAFNPRQQREFQNRGNFQPSFSDILYFTLIGKGG